MKLGNMTDLKSVDRKVLRVQLPPSALEKSRKRGEGSNPEIPVFIDAQADRKIWAHSSVG